MKKHSHNENYDYKYTYRYILVMIETHLSPVCSETSYNALHNFAALHLSALTIKYRDRAISSASDNLEAARRRQALSTLTSAWSFLFPLLTFAILHFTGIIPCLGAVRLTVGVFFATALLFSVCSRWRVVFLWVNGSRYFFFIVCFGRVSIFLGEGIVFSLIK